MNFGAVHCVLRVCFRAITTVPLAAQGRAHLSIDTSKNGAKIDRNLFGQFAENLGDQDGLRIDAGKLHEILNGYGITNSFEIYQGTHTSAVSDRFQNYVMPFFSKNLRFTVPNQKQFTEEI
jgi:hypothetical protein